MTIRRRLLLAFLNEAIVGLRLLVVRTREDVKVSYTKISIQSNNQGPDFHLRAIRLKLDFLLPSLSVYTSIRASASTYRSDLHTHSQPPPFNAAPPSFLSFRNHGAVPRSPAQDSPLLYAHQKVLLRSRHKTSHAEPTRLLLVALPIAATNHISDQRAIVGDSHFFGHRAETPNDGHAG